MCLCLAGRDLLFHSYIGFPHLQFELSDSFFFSNEFIDLKLWASFFFFFACYSYCSLLLTDPLLWCSVPRLVCVTGRAADNRSDIVQVDVEQSGMGKSKETFSYLVSILQISTLLLVFAFCSICLFLHTLHLCSFFFFAPSPLGKPPHVCQLSVNRCVLWFRGMLVCGNLQTSMWAVS